MVTEEDKYKSQTLRIFGLGMLTLLGKIFLDPLGFFLKYGSLFSVLYTIFSVILALLGLIFIEKGRDIITERRKS